MFPISLNFPYPRPPMLFTGIIALFACMLSTTLTLAQAVALKESAVSLNPYALNQYKFFCDLALATSIDDNILREGRVIGWICDEDKSTTATTALLPPPPSSIPLCDWTGVICNGTVVEALDLSEMALAGTIPSSISALSQLKQLNIAGNYLYGSLPSQLGMLTALESLTAQGNSFTRALPSSLGGLTRLRVLSLNNNHFSGTIHTNIGNIGSSLEFLNLANNLLDVNLPATFSKMQRLWYLDYEGNSAGRLPDMVLPALEFLVACRSYLSGGVPVAIGQMKRLIQLDASTNALTGPLPDSLSGLSNLEMLWLLNNRITKIHAGIGSMRTLRKISLRQNNLGSSIPPSIGRLHNLVLLDLSSNALVSSLPDTLVSLTSLEILDLSYNQLNGGVPRTIGRLISLKELSLNSNKLDGTVAGDIKNCTKLTDIKMQYNKLVGPIPLHIGDLSQLIYFVMSRNSLSGQIPLSMSALTRLRYLMLDFNRLSGAIPFRLSVMSLSILYLNDNELEGSIGTLNSLYSLELQNNFFTGRISIMADVTYLNLANNFFSGPAPTAVLSGAMVVELQNNFFHGAVPSCGSSASYALDRADYSNNRFDSMPYDFFARCYSIWSLDVSRNLISSRVISFEYAKFRGLSYLDLSDNLFYSSLKEPHPSFVFSSYFSLRNNRIEGNVPQKLIKGGYSFSVFDLSRNKFVGKFPKTILSNSISYFDVSKNNFSGPLPSKIQTNSFSYFDASHNMFNGTVPLNFWGNLSGSRLKVFSLAFNKLSGSVPSSLSQLAGLELLDLSSNHFSGTLPVVSSRGTLKRLSIASNRFHRFHPSTAWGAYPSLLEVDLSHNAFSKIAVPDFSASTKLQTLRLNSNLFTGLLPASLSRMTLLTILDLSDLPTLLARVLPKLTSPSLVTLKVSNASLVGNMDSLVSAFSSSNGFANLRYLDVSGNHLVGNLSSRKIAKFRALTYLNVQQNSLTGAIPYALCSDLPNLTTFLISSNRLECMPTCFRTLANGGAFISDFDTQAPTTRPSRTPTFSPSAKPSLAPTYRPSVYSLIKPSALPSFKPTTASPTVEITSNPTVEPSTFKPTISVASVSWCPDPTITPSAQPTPQPTAMPTPSTQVPTSQPSHELYDQDFANEAFYDLKGFYSDPGNEVCQGDIIVKRLKKDRVTGVLGAVSVGGGDVYDVMTSSDVINDGTYDNSSSEIGLWSFWCEQLMSSYEFPLLFDSNLRAVEAQRSLLALAERTLNSTLTTTDITSDGEASPPFNPSMYDLSHSYSSSTFLSGSELPNPPTKSPSTPPTITPTTSPMSPTVGPTTSPMSPTVKPTTSPSISPLPTLAPSGSPFVQPDTCFNLGNYWCYNNGCRLESEIPTGGCTGGGAIPAKCPENAMCLAGRYTCNAGFVDNFNNNNPGEWGDHCSHCRIPHTCIAIASTTSPTTSPTFTPSSANPTARPSSYKPSQNPPAWPGRPTFAPSRYPTVAPSCSPSEAPTRPPSRLPTQVPSPEPSRANDPQKRGDVLTGTSLFVSGSRFASEVQVACPGLLTTSAHSGKLKILPISSQFGWESGQSAIYQQITVPGSSFELLKQKYLDYLASSIVNLTSTFSSGHTSSLFQSPLLFLLAHIDSVVLSMKGAAVGGERDVQIASARRSRNASSEVSGNLSQENASTSADYRLNSGFDCRSTIEDVIDDLCTPAALNQRHLLRHKVGWTSSEISGLIVCQLVSSGFVNYSTLSADDFEKGDYQYSRPDFGIPDGRSMIDFPFHSSSSSSLSSHSRVNSTSSSLSFFLQAVGQDKDGYDGFIRRWLAAQGPGLSAQEMSDEDVAALRGRLSTLLRRSFSRNHHFHLLFFKGDDDNASGDDDDNRSSISSSIGDYSINGNQKLLKDRAMQEAAAGAALSEWHTSQGGNNAPILTIFFT